VSGDRSSFYDVCGLGKKVSHNLVPYENKLNNIDVLKCGVDHEIYSIIYWLQSNGNWIDLHEFWI